MNKEYKCSVCGNIFGLNKTLRQHVREKHPEESLNDIAPLEKNKREKIFECSDCKKSFTTKKYLKSHQKIAHSSPAPAPARAHLLRTCPLCSRSFKNLKEHTETDHQINLESEVISFSSEQEFLVWKTDVEKNTTAYFRFRRKENLADGSSCRVYSCNRSGIYRKKGDGVRHLKMKGSRKIGGTCPAEIKVCTNGDGLTVTFLKTHVGHTHQLQHLDLPKSDKDSFAAQIANKIPFEHILNQVRDSISDKRERKHLITKKDLMNIEAQYGLESEAVRHIHLVCKRTKKKSKKEPLIDETELHDELHIHEEQDKCGPILDSLKSMSSVKISSVTFESKKNSFILDLVSKLNGIQNEKELNAVMKIVAPIEPTITALREQVTEFPKPPKVPANKSIKAQRKFKCTKKSREQKKRDLTKPMNEDAEIIAATLFLDN